MRRERKEHKSDPVVKYEDAKDLLEIEWWQSLDEQGKWNAYKHYQRALECYADTLDEITDHLLGKDWYAMTCDSTCYGVNPEIVSCIKFRYADVNVSITDRIKKCIKNFFRI